MEDGETNKGSFMAATHLFVSGGHGRWSCVLLKPRNVARSLLK